MAKITGLKRWRNGEIINARDYVYERDLVVTLLNEHEDVKLDKVNAIYVDTALPATLASGDFNNRWFLIREASGLGHLYYISDGAAVEVELKVGQVNLAITGIPTDALGVGELRYNDTTGSIDLGIKGGYTLKIGEDLIKRVRNDSGALLKRGQVVYISGAIGNSGLLQVKKADNVGENTSSKTFGIVWSQMDTGGETQDGYVLIYGLLQGVNLNDSDVNDASSPLTSADVGKAIWLGSNGKLRKDIPTGDTQHSVFVGYLENWGGNGNNASIYVKIQNGYEIGELHDVRLSSTADKDVLVYDSTRGVWKNSPRLTNAEGNIVDAQNDILTLQDDVLGLDTTKADITYVDAHKSDTNNPHQVTKSQVGLGNVDNESKATMFTNPTFTGTPVAPTAPTITDTTQIATTEFVNNAVDAKILTKADLVDGKVPAAQLPSYVDDIIEAYVRTSATPTEIDWLSLVSTTGAALTPEVGKIYVIVGAVDSNYIDRTYRWGGSAYALIGDMALGTTSATAFPGDRGLNLETLTNTAGQTTNGLVIWDGSKFISNSTAIFTSATGRVSSSQLFASNAIFTPYVASANGQPSSSINFASSGTTISRNINDANPTLIVNNIHASSTGNIANFQFAGANKLEITKDGFLNQNGTRLLSTTGTQNVFLGADSGNLTNTSTWSIGIGHESLLGLTSGVRNVAVGKNALKGTTTGAENVAVGYRTGESLITGTKNTFLGVEAGLSASQKTDATNSTALGNGSFTDKSNQMVFGNASVSEFKFDRNTSAIVLMPQIQTSSSNAFTLERTSSNTNSTVYPFLMKATSTGDMVDGFGSRILFQIRDNANADNNIGFIGLDRSGADNSGRVVFGTNNAGTLTEKMTIMPNGKVGIGTSSPALTNYGAELTLSSLSGEPEAQLNLQGSATTDVFVANINLWNSTNRIARISAVRNGANNSGRLAFRTNNAGTETEKMTIMPNGNVGIGTTAPATTFSVITSANTDGIQIRRSSTTTNDYALLGFRVATTDNVINTSEIRSIRTNRAVSADSDLTFHTFSNTALTERMRIRDDGNVGIGTTTPATRLDVNGVINTNNNISWANGNADINGQDANLKFRTWTGSALTEKMRILGNGNVGINSLTPLAKLVVAGNDGFTFGGVTPTNVAFQVSNSNTNYGMLFATAANGQGYIQQRRNDTTEAYYALNLQSSGGATYIGSANGLVGINEISPTAQLQVKSGATTRVPLIVDTLTSGHTANIVEFNGNNSIRFSVGADGLIRTTNGIANMNSANNSRIDISSSGTTISRNVADANPSLVVNQIHASSTGDIARFQFGGSTKLAINKDGVLKSPNGNNSIGVDNSFAFIGHNVNDANPVLSLEQINASATGDFLKGLDSTQTEQFYIQIDGDMYNTNGTYGTISDERLKENIVQARNYTEDLMKLNVVKYSFKKDKSDKPTHLGFIAQEVEQVFPNLVETHKTKELEDMKTIKMSVLIPMLVKTIQELKKEIDELKGK